MYLVELKPGIEAIYSSVAELTEAVRRGEVTPSAKVFHRARSEWAPITAHPKFREIVASLAGPARREWTFLPAKGGKSSPEPIEPPVEETMAAHTASAAPAKAPSRRGWRSVFGTVFRQHTA